MTALDYLTSFMWNYTVPFKFDIPSPDDVVSKGLRSSKVDLKGILWWLQILLLL